MRSKDRLNDLTQRCQSIGKHDAVASYSTASAVRAEGVDALSYLTQIEHILNEEEGIRVWIRQVEDNTALVRRLHADPTYHYNANIQEQVERLICYSNELSTRACGAVRCHVHRAPSTPLAERVRRVQRDGTRSLLADALAAHQRLLDELRDHQRHLLLTQIKFTNLEISEEETEHLIDAKQVSLFVQNVREETAQARLELNEAESRHAALLHTERALREVRDLMLHLAHLISEQQDKIDSVEYYALQAKEHVDGGGQQLLKGKINHAKARKKKVGCAICVTVAVTLVLIILICS